MVELGGMAERLPEQLSGGQQQRVALARAIVFQPRLLLLDEPFGALDRKLREQMQLEVRRLQRRLGLTTLFITHDQEEALVMSDRIAVMDKGTLQQVGPPHEIYEAPGQPLRRRLHRRVQHLRRRGRSRRRRHAAGAARARADDRGRRPRDLAARRGQQVRVMVRPERFVDLAADAESAHANRIDGRSPTAPISACRTSTGSPRADGLES